MREQWPCTLWIVRHGQSAGNVARDAAEAAGHHIIDIAERDIDTPLSELGRRQARALGLWFGELPSERRPQVVLCSPYIRARETARLLLHAAGISGNSVRLRFDERLREKEARRIVLKLKASDGLSLDKLQAVLAQYRGGNCHLAVQFHGDGARGTFSFGADWNVKPTPALIEELEGLLGRGRIAVLYSPPPQSAGVTSIGG